MINRQLFKHLKGDFFGGLTAGIVALPLALAFGVSSGLGPSAGLYGAIFIAFFASLFGGTNTQISGPTAPMTAVSLVIIGQILAENGGELTKAIPIILGVFILAGIIQIFLGLVGAGKFIHLIPLPVISGFMSAIGVIIIITQISPALGYYPEQDKQYLETFRDNAEEIVIKEIIEEQTKNEGLFIGNLKNLTNRIEEINDEAVQNAIKQEGIKNSSGVIGSIKTFPNAVKNINWIEFGLALSTILIIVVCRKITTKIPATLIGLIVVSSFAFVFEIPFKPIEEIPSSLPQPNLQIFHLESFFKATSYIGFAVTLSLLGAIDSLLTSLVADNLTQTKHQPNKELIGQGIGNSIAALYGGIPGAGATIRTVVNIRAGGKTRISGMIAGSILFLVLIALGPIASNIPSAVLAGILLLVGIDVIDYKGLKEIPKLPKTSKIGKLNVNFEVIIMIVVLILSSVWNLVYAVGIGFALSCIIFMNQIAKISKETFVVKPLNDNNAIDRLTNINASCITLKGSIFFGNTNDFENALAGVTKKESILFIDFTEVNYLDYSGVKTLGNKLVSLNERDIQVIIFGLSDSVFKICEVASIIPNVINKEQIFKNKESALSSIQEVSNRI